MSESPQKPKSMFRYYDPERDKRDKEVIGSHEQAKARGEARSLVRTVEGELFSYKKEEIGFVTGGTGPKIASGGGMLVTGTLFWLGTVALGVFAFLAQGPSAGERTGLFFVTAMLAAGGWYFMHLGMAEHRARKLRKARGLPKPSLQAPLHLP